MKVYFVRHGESTYNAENVYQPADSALSQKGIKQAEILASRFKSIPIDIIFSSPLERARQTAEIINRVVSKKILYTELLQEVRRPSEMIGKAQGDPETKRIFRTINEHANEPDWRYGDGENFTDLEKRGEKFLQLLKGKTEENVLCVTHATIMRMIICLMMDQNLTWKFYEQFLSFFQTSNTGITLCVQEERKWRLLTWNDHAHLG